MRFPNKDKGASVLDAPFVMLCKKGLHILGKWSILMAENP